MSTLQKQNGPASAPTLPDRGSDIPQKGKPMNTQPNTTSQAKAASDELWDRAWDLLNGMESKLLRTKNLAEMLWMAGESFVDMDKRNAITTQCDVMQDELRQVLDMRGEMAAMILGRVPA